MSPISRFMLQPSGGVPAMDGGTYYEKNQYVRKGQAIHFVTPDNQHTPAVIVDVVNTTTGEVILQVDNDPAATAGRYTTHANYDDEGQQQHTWHWHEG